MSSVARMKTLDRLSASIPLVDFKRIDIRQPSLVRVLVDSKTAEEMLSYNVKNRRQRRAAVEYLKAQISNGEWRDDHPQPVIFSDHGRLIDGQHRLQAIAEMGIGKHESVVVRVETGARDDVREYLDTGVPRSLDDRVELVEDQIHNKVISQLCAAGMNLRQGKVKRPSPEDARVFFADHAESSLFVARNLKRDKGVGRIQIGYAAMEYYEIQKEKAVEFYPAIFVMDSPVQQARVFRDWALRAATTSRAMVENNGAIRNDVYHRAIFCMKAHKAGKPISQVKKGEW
jgi:hypothetical protein